MTYVITERCVGNRYTDCVVDCPVDCFYELEDPPLLIINPDECIDCDACVPLCPVNAIYPEDEVPEDYWEWGEKNDASLCGDENRVTETKGSLEGALSVDEIKKGEEEKYGHVIQDRSGAGY